MYENPFDLFFRAVGSFMSNPSDKLDNCGFKIHGLNKEVVVESDGMGGLIELHHIKNYNHGTLQDIAYQRIDNKEPHRIQGPAIVLLRPNGEVYKEQWLQNGDYHRENGPSIIEFSNSGLITREEWYWRGEIHNSNGPAVRKWDNSNSLIEEIWCTHGRRHRTDGPAHIMFAKMIEVWFINGEDITSEVLVWARTLELPRWNVWSEEVKMMFRLTFGG